MSSQPYRHPKNGLIERGRTLAFRFDGRDYTGHPGDTLASALLANGVRIMGRSFKYHRPRGLVAAGSAEPNALVELREGARRTPNVPATTVELYDGLVATSQNRWPSLGFDLMGVNDFMSPLFVAGFYYKTFKWPAAFWKPVYEPLIRRAAGLGRPAKQGDPDRYERAHLHCDLLVVGGGPAGLAAALTAGRAGARVALCDEGPRLGGSLLNEHVEIGGDEGAAWADKAVNELATLPNVHLLPRTTVFGAYDHKQFGAVERLAEHLPEPEDHTARERFWHIDAAHVVLASGALERPIGFQGNDLPGVMLASAARSFANRHAVRPGSRAVVFGNSDDIFATARDLDDAGVIVKAVVDSRTGASVRRARGRKVLRRVELGSGERIDCDLLCVAGGWNPVLHLSSQRGVRPVWNEDLACFLPGEGEMTAVGAAAGRFSTAEAIRDGAKAGAEAAQAAGYAAQPLETPKVADPPMGEFKPLWIVPGKAKRIFVDFQHDVTVADIKLADREGYRSAEHMKRYTTFGMATDQGRVGNLLGLAALGKQQGKTIPEVGTTTFRPPYTPVSLGAFAGYNRQRTFQPVRRSPLHDWGVERGATFVEAGPWLRIRAFPRVGEDLMAASLREARAVRSCVGVTDVSTLGKIDIQGPDAAEFLNRLYINGWKTLPVGRARYGLMLREDGIVLDDGTTSRLGEIHYLMTTTTGNAGPVMAHLEYCHQVHWPELDVQYVSVTDQWAGLAVAGPNARKVLQRLLPEADLSKDAFPFMAAGTFEIQGVPARLFRISFSGELGYEINVPADYGHALANLVMEIGATYGISPYGLEALDVLRIEKGHVTAAELNGHTTAGDLGFAGMMSTKKDYIGRWLAERPGLKAEDRPQLVGLKPLDGAARLHGGAHLLADGAEATAENDQGYLTSAAFSPVLGQWIALAMLARGPERLGERIRAVDLLRGEDVTCEVVPHIFYDSAGGRQRA